MHIITLTSSDDICHIRDACKAKYQQWEFKITKEESVGQEAFKLEALWIPVSYVKRKKTQLTIAESHMMCNLIPTFASAFYTGMCKERETKV